MIDGAADQSLPRLARRGGANRAVNMATASRARRNVPSSLKQRHQRTRSDICLREVYTRACSKRRPHASETRMSARLVMCGQRARAREHVARVNRRPRAAAADPRRARRENPPLCFSPGRRSGWRWETRPYASSSGSRWPTPSRWGLPRQRNTHNNTITHNNTVSSQDVDASSSDVTSPLFRYIAPNPQVVTSEGWRTWSWRMLTLYWISLVSLIQYGAIAHTHTHNITCIYMFLYTFYIWFICTFYFVLCKKHKIYIYIFKK